MFPVFAKTVLKSFVDKAFPVSKTGRPRSATTEELIDHIFILLRTGTQWRLLPTGDKVSWQTVHRHFQKWSKEGIFQRTYDHLLKLYCTKFSKTRQFIITDCSFVKNIFGIDCLGPSPVDRGRKASKLSIIVDEQGIVWSATFHPGNKSDPKAFLHTLSQASQIHAHLPGKKFYADKAYDNRRCDDAVQAAGMINKCWRRKVTYSFCAIRARVEHVFSWLDKYRRILVRYERFLVHYKSLTFFALMVRLSKSLTNN